MIAYLIMCHKNVDQVIRLAKKVKTNNSEVYIHADSDMAENEYKKLIEFKKKNDGINVLRNRLHGELDRRNLVDIAMRLIDESQNSINSYKYYILMSGQDYIIKPVAYIEDKLKETYPKPYIDCTPYHESNWLYYKFNVNSTIIKCNSWITNKFKKGVIRKILRGIVIILSKIQRFLRFDAYHKLCKLDVDMYGGSAWWILPDKIIDYIKGEYDNNSKIVQILLNHTNTPEEHFFQMMSMRSPLGNVVELNPIDMVAQNCKTWAYFSDEGKPFKGHPYIVTIEEFEKLKQSVFWFARKFDITVDQEILDKLDEVCV